MRITPNESSQTGIAIDGEPLTTAQRLMLVNPCNAAEAALLADPPPGYRAIRCGWGREADGYDHEAARALLFATLGVQAGTPSLLHWRDAHTSPGVDDDGEPTTVQVPAGWRVLRLAGPLTWAAVQAAAE